MTAERGRLNDHGVTLIELLVVLVIIGVLAVAGAFQYQGWQGSYRVEGEVKQMYIDLMNARSMAIGRSRMFFINVPAGNDKQYLVFEDTDGGLDGDRQLTAADTIVTNTPTSYSLSLSTSIIGVNGKGMITNGLDDSGMDILAHPEYIRFVTDSSLNPDYDCIEFISTRINMGKWDGSKCAEK